MGTRAAQALALRLAGVDWLTITERLGYDDVTHAMEDATTAAEGQYDGLPADPVRILEVLRLDRLQAAVWSAAMKGDLSAANVALAIADRRARLLRLHSRTE